jgi:hypothetical protein
MVSIVANPALLVIHVKPALLAVQMAPAAREILFVTILGKDMMHVAMLERPVPALHLAVAVTPHTTPALAILFVVPPETHAIWTLLRDRNA